MKQKTFHQKNSRAGGRHKGVGLILLAFFCLTIPAAGAPKITWEKSGESRTYVRGTTRVKHIFTFRNEGDTRLNISRVRQGCSSCSLFNLSRRSLAPGDEAKLEIETIFLPGEISRKTFAYIETNDPTNRLFQIAINDEIPGLGYPAQIFFGAIPAKTPAVKKVELRVSGGGQFSIRESRWGPEVENVSIEPLEPGKRYVLEVRLKPQPAGKPIRDAIRLTTDYPEHEEIVIWLYANTTSP